MEVEGRVVWGVEYGRRGEFGGVYSFDEVSYKWSIVAGGGVVGGRLAVCGGRMVWVGGLKFGVCSKDVMELRGGRWSYMNLVFMMGGQGMDRAVWCANIHDLVSH